MWLTRWLGPLLLVVTTADSLNSCLTNARCAPRVSNLRLNTCGLSEEDVPDLVACFDRIGRRNIRSINLANNDIRNLPADLFEGLTALRTLDLADNNMGSLPFGAFEGLTSLRVLSLDENSIILEPGNFVGVTSLETLSLGDNGILSEELPGAFEGLTSLRQLFLNLNALESLSAEIFQGLPSLVELSLSDNEISTVDRRTFAGSPALEFLELDQNDLRTLNSDIFDGIRGSLTDLDLSSNDIITLPADVFEVMAVLKTLDLGSNGLEALPANIFDDLAKLQTLWLNRNELVTLPAGLFEGTPELQELSLIDNDDLQCIPAIPNSVDVDVQISARATCDCPEFSTCDEDVNVCRCQPGRDGFSCGSSFREVIRAFECTLLGSGAPALVDAGERTRVTVKATGFDDRTSGSGCSPDGCKPENTRDNDLDANSRWSCGEDFVDGDDGCCIEYFFDEPQDIVDMNIAFFRGTERTRTLDVFDNGNFRRQIVSSGTTDGFEGFVLNSDETADIKLCLEESALDSEFLSITEVQFLVE